MIKKFIFSMCCLVPFGAIADCNVVDGILECSPAVGDSVVVVTDLSTALHPVVIKLGDGLDLTGTGGLNITGGMQIGFDNVGTAPDGEFFAEYATGNVFTIRSGGDVYIGQGVYVSDGRTLKIQGLTNPVNVTVNGDVDAEGAMVIQNVGSFTATNGIISQSNLDVSAQDISTRAIEVRSGDISLVADNDLTLGMLSVTGTGDANLRGGTIVTADIQNNAATMMLDATDTVGSGASITINGLLDNKGNSVIVQNAPLGMLVTGIVINDENKNMKINAAGLNIDGGSASNSSVVNRGNMEMNITGTARFKYGIDLAGVHNTFKLNAGKLEFGPDTSDDVWNAWSTNNFDLFQVNIANAALDMRDILNGVSNDGATMELSATNVNAESIRNMGRKIQIDATDTSGGVISIAGNVQSTATGAKTYLTASGDISIGGNIIMGDAGDMRFQAHNVNIGAINQAAGTMNITADTVHVHGDIDARNLQLSANDSTNWLSVMVDGDVLGNTMLFGLKNMQVSGKYIFDNNSMINASVLDASPSISLVSLNTSDDSISISTSGQAIIGVNGDFTVFDGNGTGIPAVGLVLNNNVIQGDSAIWLVHSDTGVVGDNLFSDLLNMNVQLLGSDGIWYNTLPYGSPNNGTTQDLPVIITAVDSDGNGVLDNLFVVFNSQFGQPVDVFRIQPVVGLTKYHTASEYESAGALDDVIEAQLRKKGFTGSIPLDAIPNAFADTNISTMMNALYDRMKYYDISRNGNPLARFSRLFRPRELEQIADGISLAQHANSRAFEGRMFDEFMWNRNRKLRKVWVDADYGLVRLSGRDDNNSDGHRINVSVGADWQTSKTVILGVSGRIAQQKTTGDEFIDLGYLPGQNIPGYVHTDLKDTDFGLGAYFMKFFGNNMRMYGNAFVDMHQLDVTRHQTYMDDINGDAVTFSIMSEWGLLHDLYNRYIVGNVYARAGYTFGFDLTEKSGGQDYMKMKYDGYFTLTPGYAVTLQKRIYPSAWFQIRPYATLGVEYEVLGATDHGRYKLAMSDEFTRYTFDVSPWWGNFGGGLEFLTVAGAQVGIGYTYQYNPDVQLHNFRLSGLYRF